MILKFLYVNKVIRTRFYNFPRRWLHDLLPNLFFQPRECQRWLVTLITYYRCGVHTADSLTQTVLKCSVHIYLLVYVIYSYKSTVNSKIKSSGTTIGPEYKLQDIDSQSEKLLRNRFLQIFVQFHFLFFKIDFLYWTY